MAASNMSVFSVDVEGERWTKGVGKDERVHNLDNDFIIIKRVEEGLKRWKWVQTKIPEKQRKVAKGGRSRSLESYTKERDLLVEQMQKDIPELQAIFNDECSNEFDRKDNRRITTGGMRNENSDSLLSAESEINRFTSRLEKGRKSKEVGLSSLRSPESEINQLKRQLENERKTKEEALLILFRLRSAESEINQLTKQLENERQSKTESLLRLRSAESEINQLKKQLEDERKSKEEALLRLTIDKSYEEKEKELKRKYHELETSLARQLRDNNPNTVELSDPNRPTKLSEQLSDLYDNEWMDAFDELEKLLGDKEEKKIISYLRDFVLEIHSVCSHLSFSKLKTIEEAIVKPSVPSENTKIPTNILQTIKDGIKSMAPKLLQHTSEIVLAHLEKKYLHDPVARCLQHHSVKRYIDKCTEVCWYMSVQDPQLVMDGSKSPDDKFDSIKYREYTKKGPYEEFVVWPVLYLYKGGQMLSKGVAQGAKKQMTGQR